MRGLFPSIDTTKQFIKFTIVNLLTIGVSVLTTYLFNDYVLKNSFQYSYMVAYLSGIVTGGITDFFLSKFWTFQSYDTSKETLIKEYKRFFLTNVWVTIFNMGMLFLLTSIIGVYYVVSQTAILIFRKIILYFAYRFWTFKKEEIKKKKK